MRRKKIFTIFNELIGILSAGGVCLNNRNRSKLDFRQAAVTPPFLQARARYQFGEPAARVVVDPVIPRLLNHSSVRERPLSISICGAKSKSLSALRMSA